MNGELLAWLQSMLSEGREACVFRFNGDPASNRARASFFWEPVILPCAGAP